MSSGRAVESSRSAARRRPERRGGASRRGVERRRGRSQGSSSASASASASFVVVVVVVVNAVLPCRRHAAALLLPCWPAPPTAGFRPLVAPLAHHMTWHAGWAGPPLPDERAAHQGPRAAPAGRPRRRRRRPRRRGLDRTLRGAAVRAGEASGGDKRGKAPMPPWPALAPLAPAPLSLLALCSRRAPRRRTRCIDPVVRAPASPRRARGLSRRRRAPA
jgi:hypothetical protein